MYQFLPITHAYRTPVLTYLLFFYCQNLYVDVIYCFPESNHLRISRILSFTYSEVYLIVMLNKIIFNCFRLSVFYCENRDIHFHFFDFVLIKPLVVSCALRLFSSRKVIAELSFNKEQLIQVRVGCDCIALIKQRFLLFQQYSLSDI